MGTIVRLLVILINVISFLVVKTEDADLFISYLLVFNSLAFAVFYYFDFSLIFKKLNKRPLNFENEIANFELKLKIFKELKHSSGMLLNWLTVIIPLFFLLFVKSHSFTKIDAFFSLIIFLHLLLNIVVLSIIMRNSFRRYYVLYIVIIGVVFQTYTSMFEFTKFNLLWFSVIVILITYILIILLTSLALKRSER